jgi:hypothetical protein
MTIKTPNYNSRETNIPLGKTTATECRGKGIAKSKVCCEIYC